MEDVLLEEAGDAEADGGGRVRGGRVGEVVELLDAGGDRGGEAGEVGEDDARVGWVNCWVGGEGGC